MIQETIMSSPHERTQTASSAKSAARCLDAVMLYSPDSMSILHVDAHYRALLGFSESEIRRMRTTDIDPSLTEDRLRSIMRAKRHPIRKKTFHRSKDGSILPVDAAYSVVEIENRRYIVAHVSGAGEHERQRMNSDFLAELDALFSHPASPDAIEQAVVDRLGRYLDSDRCTFAEIQGDTIHIRREYNRGLKPTLGRYRAADVLHRGELNKLKGGAPLIVDELKPNVRSQSIRAGFRSLEIASLIEYPVMYDGDWVASLSLQSRSPRQWLEEEVQLLRDTAARLWPILKLTRTVDDLHVSKARLSQAQRAAHCGIWEWDIVNDELYLSPELHQLIELDLPSALDYASGIQLIAPEDRQRVLDNVGHALSGGAKAINEEFRVPHTILGLAWANLRGKIIRDDDGRALRIVGVILDLTQRKLTEAALKESEEQLRMALDAAEIGMWSWNPTQDAVCIDARCREIYGRPQEDDGPAPFSAYTLSHSVHPDDRPRLAEAVIAALDPNGDGKLGIEHRVMHPDGAVRHVLCKGAAYFEGVGDERRVSRVLGLLFDLTERKQAEEKLRISEERYRFAVEASAGVLYDFNVLSGYVERSTGLEGMLGYMPDETEPTIFWWQSRMHEEDKSAFEAAFHAALARRDPTFEGEYRIRHRDGRWIHVSDKARMLYDADGRLIRVVGNRVDVSEQKRAQEALRDSEQMLALIYDNSSDCLYLAAVESGDRFRFVSVNQTFLRMSGLNKADVESKPVDQILSIENPEFGLQPYRDVLTTQKPVIYRSSNEWRGGPQEAEVTLIPILDEAGQVTHILGSIKDITARVQAEDALRASEEHLRLALEGGQLGTWDIDFERGMVRYDQRAQAIIGRPGKAELSIAESYSILYGNTPLVPQLEGPAETAQKPSEYDFYHPISWPDGTTHWVSARGQVIFKGEGENRQGVRLVGVISDVTERKRIEDRLRQREAFISAINNTARVAICVYDLEARKLMYANQYFEHMLGFSLDELHRVCTRRLSDLVHPDDVESLALFLSKCRQAMNGDLLMHEYRVRHKDGSYRWLQANNAPFARDDEGEVTQILIVMEDITERKQGEEALRASEARYRALVHATSTAVWRMSGDGMRRLSIVGAGLYARNEPEDTAGAWLELVHREDREQTLNSWTAAVRSRSLYEIEHRLRMADGSYHYFHSRAVPVLDDNGQTLEWMGSSVDISERKEAEAALQEAEQHALAYQREQIRLANEDALTALPNRHWLMNFLPKALEHAYEQRSMLAILFVDLDEFKVINDTLGHAVGDELLHAAAMRLKRAVRPHDHVVRLGGDEFTLILDPIMSPSEAAEIAERITKAFREPFALSRGNKSVGASIGISLFPQNGEDVGTLLKHADIAMYASKAAGKSRYCFYEDEFYRKLQARREAEHALLRALESDQLVLHYQPRVDTFTGELRSMEALVRWEHPERGLVMPHEFISLAEETGSITRLGELVLNKACTQLVAWQKQNLPLVPVSINVSARQFGLGDVKEHFSAAIAQHDIDPRLVELEITESSMMGNETQVDEQLYALRESGIKLLIDDFGTGYSSLSQLQRLDLDVLKVDQAFTAELDKTLEGEVFFKAIVSMAHALGMCVVAEGVENLMQLKMLQALSCDEIQGHFISRPVPADQMSLLMRKRSLLPPGCV